MHVNHGRVLYADPVQSEAVQSEAVQSEAVQSEGRIGPLRI